MTKIYTLVKKNDLQGIRDIIKSTLSKKELKSMVQKAEKLSNGVDYPLTLAARLNEEEIVLELLKAGANVAVTDDEERTAKDYAEAYQNEKMIEYLEQFENQLESNHDLIIQSFEKELHAGNSEEAKKYYQLIRENKVDISSKLIKWIQFLLRQIMYVVRNEENSELALKWFSIMEVFKHHSSIYPKLFNTQMNLLSSQDEKVFSGALAQVFLKKHFTIFKQLLNEMLSLDTVQVHAYGKSFTIFEWILFAYQDDSALPFVKLMVEKGASLKFDRTKEIEFYIGRGDAFIWDNSTKELFLKVGNQQLIENENERIFQSFKKYDNALIFVLNTPVPLEKKQALINYLLEQLSKSSCIDLAEIISQMQMHMGFKAFVAYKKNGSQHYLEFEEEEQITLKLMQFFREQCSAIPNDTEKRTLCDNLKSIVLEWERGDEHKQAVYMAQMAQIAYNTLKEPQLEDKKSQLLLYSKRIKIFKEKFENLAAAQQIMHDAKRFMASLEVNEAKQFAATWKKIQDSFSTPMNQQSSLAENNTQYSPNFHQNKHKSLPESTDNEHLSAKAYSILGKQ